MKEQIPPLLRPDFVTPVSLKDFAAHFGLDAPAQDAVLTGISMNTNDLRPGDLFVAMPGKKTHGAQFIEKALELGATAVATDTAGLAQTKAISVPVVRIENPRQHLGNLAAYVYGNLPGKMPLLLELPELTAKPRPLICWKQFCAKWVKLQVLRPPPSVTSLAKQL